MKSVGAKRKPLSGGFGEGLVENALPVVNPIRRSGLDRRRPGERRMQQVGQVVSSPLYPHGAIRMTEQEFGRLKHRGTKEQVIRSKSGVEIQNLRGYSRRKTRGRRKTDQ